MSLAHHLEEATSRLEHASARIDAARERPASLDSLRDWVAALTDYVRAATDVHAYTNESVHEKLHELAGHLGLKDIPRISAFPPQ